MLEVCNLTKIYKSKTGVEVTALDNVTIKFNQTGMVFIVGKSGSGKSTLLNMIGGLDKYDGGNIIINNESSANFTQSDFDSLRNTYIGFIFQEYNLLQDFSVGANIGLALELKGEKATNDRVNEMLDLVDLSGYGSRRINELSGGQKQRVAIARALIKDPEIILADEPSGALDSKSGELVFETLKKLSKKKLVIVISHDLDFAQRYGDRIIELADGRVISDVERTGDYEESVQSDIDYNANSINIVKGYTLTKDDIIAINNYLKEHSDADLNYVDANKNSCCGFIDTDESAYPIDHNKFEPIRSKLPLKNAIKIGASNLKIKVGRLILTIILSIISFTMFGLYDTIASFNERTTTINSLYDNNITTINLEKKKVITTEYDSDTTYTYYQSKNMDKDDLKKLHDDLGVDFTGVYSPSFSLSFISNIGDTSKLSFDYKFVDEDSIASYLLMSQSYYSNYFNGIVELAESDISKANYTLIGSYPTDSTQVIIPEYMAETFVVGGYKESSSSNVVQISSINDMIGKSLTFSNGTDSYSYTISGILTNTKKADAVSSKYATLKNYDKTPLTDAEALALYVKHTELDMFLESSYNGMLIVKDGTIDDLMSKNCGTYNMTYNYSFNNSCFKHYNTQGEIDGYYYCWTYYRKTQNTNLLASGNVTYLGSYNESSLTGNNILVSEYLYNEITDDKAQSVSNPYNYNESLTFNIIGYYTDDYNSILMPDDLYDYYAKLWGINAPYSSAFGNFDGSKGMIAKFYDYSQKVGEVGGTNYSYRLSNHIMTIVEIASEIFAIITPIFMWVGIIFAIFSMLLLANFITLGILNKKVEIGILRAIGARGIDVFKIFYSESLIIALINFVLSTILTLIIISTTNTILMAAGVVVTLFSFGLRQVGLILLVSILASFIASFFPVSRFARKRPVDVINNR